MKRYNNIFNKICDVDNLEMAHNNARRDKIFYKEVKMVDKNKKKYLTLIQEMLINKTYKVSPYSIIKLNDKGKERVLHKLPYYPDRIIQWAIMLQIEKIFLNTFTSFTCASMPKRGIHKAVKLMNKYLKDKENTRYTLKMDVSKFYPSINHEILKQLLRKKIKDKDLLELLDKIVDSMEGEKGVPIGSYLSQYFANYYLAFFDHWLKEEKHCKYVVRYMDDIVIMHKSKEHLHKLREEIEEYLDKKLKLKLKQNYQVFPTDLRGVDFVGYRHFYKFKLLRKRTCNRFKNKMLKLRDKEINHSDWCSANSYKGWLKWCDSHRLKEKYINPIQNKLNEYYKKNIKIIKI